MIATGRIGAAAAAVLAALSMSAVSDRADAQPASLFTSAIACPHPYGPGNAPSWRPTPIELKHILARHRGWYPSQFQQPVAEHDAYLEREDPPYLDWRREALGHAERANLCNANLRGVDLRGANLLLADLSGADLSYADLTGADLQGADLTRAVLWGARMEHAIVSYAHLRGANLSSARMAQAFFTESDLSGANVSEADLTKAVLVGANLSGTDLSGVNLNDASLGYADLSHAFMSSTHLGNAHIAFADLTDALYAPDESPDPYVVGIRGLSTLRVPFGEEAGLVQLRKLLQDGGLRDEEREATYAIEHATTVGKLDVSKHGPLAFVEGVFRLVAFEWTTGYGLYPGRALLLIAILGALLTPVYVWPILHGGTHPTKASGIYQVFPAERIDDQADDPTADHERKVIRVQAKGFKALLSAAYFSLLSAVNIGFEQFTPGDWIRRLQGQDYSVQAVGWVRTVAGAQALLSVFLLAMWALTYFGRPFQ
jgi:uncharacterized protein YjbI with pentapeptide repeats